MYCPAPFLTCLGIGWRIRYIAAPDGVRLFGIELLVQNIFKSAAVIRIDGRSGVRLYPLRFYAYLFHIFSYRSFGYYFAIFTELGSDLRCSVILIRGVVNVDDIFFDTVSAQFVF